MPWHSVDKSLKPGQSDDFGQRDFVKITDRKSKRGRQSGQSFINALNSKPFGPNDSAKGVRYFPLVGWRGVLVMTECIPRTY